MLSFVGSGSAFNTSIGNNSAFIKNNSSLFLIDCGSSVFHKLMEKNILEGIDRLYIFITHMHPDHVGSLGDLILYAKYRLGISTIIIYREKEKIDNFLNLVGVNTTYYSVNDAKDIKIIDENINLDLEIIGSIHSKSVTSYSLIFTYENTKVFYSGDSNVIPVRVLNDFEERNIKYIYQDTCGRDYKGNGHMHIAKLSYVIKEELKKFVYCMHLDESLTNKVVKEYGFNKVSNI